MGEIVELGDGKASGSENLGDFLASIAVSDSESVDSVGIVREIRESD